MAARRTRTMSKLALRGRKTEVRRALKVLADSSTSDSPARMICARIWRGALALGIAQEHQRVDMFAGWAG